jgi:hypothetical protein
MNTYKGTVDPEITSESDPAYYDIVGSIKDTRISGAAIYSDAENSCTGTFAGVLSAATVTNCSATGTITSNYDYGYIRGFAGIINGN